MAGFVMMAGGFKVTGLMFGRGFPVMSTAGFSVQFTGGFVVLATVMTSRLAVIIRLAVITGLVTGGPWVLATLMITGNMVFNIMGTRFWVL